MEETTKQLQNSSEQNEKSELNKWVDISYSHIGSHNIVKNSVFPVYKFSSIPIKIQASHFVDIDKPILKFICRDRILKENKVGG